VTEILSDDAVHLVDLLRNFWSGSLYFLADSDTPITAQEFNEGLNELIAAKKWRPATLAYGAITTIDNETLVPDQLPVWVPRLNTVNKQPRRYSTLIEARLMDEVPTTRGGPEETGIPSEQVTSYVAEAQERLSEGFGQPRDGSLAVPYQPLNDKIDLLGSFPDVLIRGHSGNAHVPTGGPGGFPRPVPKTVYEATKQTLSAALGSTPPANGRVRIYVLDTLYTTEAIDRGPLPEWWVEPTTPPLPPQRKSFSVKRMRDMLTDATKLAEWQQQTAFQSGSTFNREMYDHGPFVTDIILRHAPNTPNVEIVLVETMNQYGVGTLSGLKAVLEFLRDDLAAHRNIPKIINMSFVFDLPDKDQVKKLLEEVKKLNARSPDGSDARIVEVQRTIATLQGFYENNFDQQFIGFLFQLYETVRLVDTENTLWIAASGNTTPLETTTNPRRPAMMPANLPNVYGVMATDDVTLETPSSSLGVPTLVPAPTPYSHFPDKNHPNFPAGEGRTGFGGSAVELQTTELDGHGRKREVYISHKAVVGPYLNQDRFHLEILDSSHAGREAEFKALPNTGFAEWAGTSFAAAQVTGRVAYMVARGQTLKVAIDSIHLGRMLDD
jgi:hypothetical protein